MSGKELPWGDLTGIRPTKIPMKMLEEGKTNVEIAKYMRETYYTSPEKTALAITIANREKDILKTIDYEHGYSLYIGIPFCPSICLYCSFGSHVLSRWEHMVDPYLDALIKELTFISERMKDYTLDTIYIGGGTPTTLNAAQMERLLSKVTELFPMDQVQEFTVEAGRPDTIHEEVLKAIRKFPVTRISINPQTMNQETLDLIGRHHTVEEIEEKFRMARDLGFRQHQHGSDRWSAGRGQGKSGAYPGKSGGAEPGFPDRPFPCVKACNETQFVQRQISGNLV